MRAFLFELHRICPGIVSAAFVFDNYFVSLQHYAAAMLDRSKTGA